MIRMIMVRLVGVANEMIDQLVERQRLGIKVQQEELVFQ